MRSIFVRKYEQRVIPLIWDGRKPSLDYRIVLQEPGAAVRIVGMYYGSGEQACSGSIKVIHVAPQTTSRIVIKAALRDQSRFDLNGMVEIRPGATGSDAWLAAHVLLLSDGAKGQAIPSLEILENDVKAGHATTIGRIDEEALFYLQSRGLRREEASKLYVNGFLQSVIEYMPSWSAATARKLLAI